MQIKVISRCWKDWNFLNPKESYFARANYYYFFFYDSINELKFTTKKFNKILPRLSEDKQIIIKKWNKNEIFNMIKTCLK